MPVRRCDDQLYTLASNLAATGPTVAIRGGEYMLLVEGTVGGATITLQIQTPNGTWTTVQAFAGGALVSMTALPEAISWIPLPECNVRMGVTGGAPSALFAYLIGLG